MENTASELSEKSRQRFQEAFGLNGTSITSTEWAGLLEEYEIGLMRASQALELDEASRKNFEHMVGKTIGICSDGWPSIKKPEVRSRLEESGVSPPIADRAIDLALRMWLMIDCCEDASTLLPKTWSDDQGIEDFIWTRFDMVDDNDDAEPISRFPRKFRAVELYRLGGITVQWTSFLDEHLRFLEETRELKVFNKKALLVALLKKAGSPMKSFADDSVEDTHNPGKIESDINATGRKDIGIPRELLRETLMTLDVLFPPWHEYTTQFLESQGQDFHLVPPYPRDIPKLREFRHWRNRLLDLIVEYQAPPLDWKHIWRDRRNPAAFWTFWIGMAIFILTMIFGIIASVLAGIQVELANTALRTATAPCTAGDGR